MADGRGPPCRSQARHVATPAASIAGCVLLGAAELGLRALLAQRPQVVAQHGGRLGESLLHDRLGGRKRREHADRLRALARETRMPATCDATPCDAGPARPPDYSDAGCGPRRASHSAASEPPTAP